MQASEVIHAISTRFATIEYKEARTRKYVYLGLVFLFWISLYMLLPTLGIYSETIVDDWGVIGAVLSTYGLFQAIFRIPVGILSARMGRIKPLVLIGLALTGTGAILLGAATDVTLLFVGRALTGIGATAWALIVVMVSALHAPEEARQASARLTLVSTLGCVLAPFITALLHTDPSDYLGYYVSAGIAFLSFLVLLPARETPRVVPAQYRPISWNQIGALAGRRHFLFPALLAALAQLTAWASVFGFLPILAGRMDATNYFQAILIAAFSLAVILGNVSASLVQRHFRRMGAVYFSVIFVTVGILIGSFAVTLEIILASAVVIGLASGLGYPVLMSMAIEKVTDEEQTSAVALYQTIYALGMFIGPLFGGILAAAVGIQPMLAVTGFVSLLPGMLIAYWMASMGGFAKRAR